MGNKNQIYLGLLAIIVASLLYCGSAVLIMDQSVSQRGTRTWEDYYPLLVENNRTGKLISDVLEKEFAVLRYENINIEYFDFAGLKNVPLEGLEDKFTFLDTRYDSYMKNLGNYFYTRDRQKKIVYIKSRENPIRLFIQIRRVLKETAGQWVLLDVNWAVRGLLVIIFALLLFFSSFIIRNRKIVILFLGLPWIPIIFFGDFRTVMISSVVFFATLLSGVFLQNMIREYLNIKKIISTKSLLLPCAWIWGIVLLFIVFLSLGAEMDSRTINSLIFAFLTNIGVELAIIGGILFKKGRQIHTLFYYIPLTFKRRVKLNILRLLPVPVMIAVVILMPALVTGITLHVDTMIPKSGETRYAILDYTTLHEIEDKQDPEAPLPNAADFIKHRVFQLGWAYKLPYELPKAGSRYTISTYTQGESAVLKGEMTVLEIDDDWYGSQLTSSRHLGVLDLLLSQSGWAAVEYGKISQKPFTRKEIVVYYIAWIILQLSGLISYTHLTPITLYDMKAVELRRQFLAA